MKKLFLVLSVMILALSSVYAQDTAAETTTEYCCNKTNCCCRGNQEDSGNTNTVEGVSAFAPSFVI